MHTTTPTPPHGVHLRRTALLLGLLAAIGLLLLSSRPLQGNNPPTIRLTPNSGPTGTALRIEGQGFNAAGSTAFVVWDDQLIEQFTIEGSGPFAIDLFTPSPSSVGEHTVQVCTGDPCLTHSAEKASATFTVTRDMPHFDETVAYLYRDDLDTASAIRDLLAQHGLQITLIPLTNASGVGWSQYDLVIVAADTLSQWSGMEEDLYQQIAASRRVLGLGQGGRDFFNRLQSPLGDGQTASGVQVMPDNALLTAFHTPYELSLYVQEGLDLYATQTGMVVLPPASQTGDVLPIAYHSSLGDPSEDAAIASQGCNTLWGFEDGPDAMSELGRRLFVNTTVFALGKGCDIGPSNLCQTLSTPADIPGQTIVDFDDLADGAPLADAYTGSHGVSLGAGDTGQAVAHADQPNAHSAPNVARNGASPDLPLVIDFSLNQSHVGFWLGNGNPAGAEIPVGATLTAYDGEGAIICQSLVEAVPAAHTLFQGFQDALARIASIEVDYGNAANRESIDDLTFGPFSPANRIQVCRQVEDGCAPAAGARVYQIRQGEPTGTVLTTDDDGYVQERRRVRFGDMLWPIVPVSNTDRYTLYHTSNESFSVEASVFDASADNTLVMPVSAEHPLIVHDLQVSTQFVLAGNNTYSAWLRARIVDAANYLYDWTDGQMILGQVDVHQNYEQWNDADIWLYSSNSLRPQANVGGVVDSPTQDPLLGAEQMYYPGQVVMGRSWNRFGLPAPPTDTGLNLAQDWPLAFAHELGHYLLYLYDTYLNVTETGGMVETDACTGSAMGWVYDQTVNGELIADTTHWNAFCADTHANQRLNRTEWASVLLWYQALIAPTSVDPGPASPPAPLTSVVIHPTSAQSLGAQTFELLYVDGENASGEARAFITRNGRMLDQGRPPENTTQIALEDLVAGDRFCVYDINDFADDDEPSDRHQYGCEIVAVGDTSLQMEKDESWAPIIEVSPLTSTSIQVTVTQPMAVTGLRARLYPEHSTTSTEIPLTAVGNTHSGTIDSPVEATAAYLQIWADESSSETDPRREAVIDYGVGKGGAYGALTWYGGVPIVSSDGEAEYDSEEDVTLDEGEFAAIQSMAGTPPPPYDKRIIGQAYRLIALPRELLETGDIAIRVNQSPNGARAEAALPPAVVHFWTGSSWIPLETSYVTDRTGKRVAIAPSQGEGIYVLMRQRTADELWDYYFPWIECQGLQGACGERCAPDARGNKQFGC